MEWNKKTLYRKTTFDYPYIEAALRLLSDFRFRLNPKQALKFTAAEKLSNFVGNLLDLRQNASVRITCNAGELVGNTTERDGPFFVEDLQSRPKHNYCCVTIHWSAIERAGPCTTVLQNQEPLTAKARPSETRGLHDTVVSETQDFS